MSLYHLNIIVAGKTGVGKSTLINGILGKKVARTGIGKPVTHEITEYTSENNLFTLIDTPCITLYKKSDLLNIILQRSKTKDINKEIHSMWYCISSNSMKIDQCEIEFMNSFKNIPKIIVLTKAFDDLNTRKMHHLIRVLKINCHCIAPVLAEDEILEDFYPPIKILNYGLLELIHFTASVFPKDSMKSFLNLFFDKLTNKNNINVIVIGKTGVGKSTLINAILGSKKVKTGIGEPITKKIEQFGDPNSIFNFFDTPGLELEESQQKKLKNDINNLICTRLKTGNVDQYIHCIWYCVNCNLSRFEETEKEFINELASKFKIPIILVITQCYDIDLAKEVHSSIKKNKINVVRVLPILAEKETFDDFDIPVIAKSFGKNKLIKATKEIRKKY